MSKILLSSDPRLLTPCYNLDFICKNWKKISVDMFTAMTRANAIGLAANQIGLDYRCFVMDCGKQPYFIGDPVVVDQAVTGSYQLEGCLSIPNQHFDIYRPDWVILSYSNGEESLTKTFFGLEARCILHEIDHLNGKLISDH